MKPVGIFVIGALTGAAVMVLPRAVAHVHTALQAGQLGSHSGEGRAHKQEEFQFTANGTMDQVAPLFGAEKERVWAADWDPHVLFPEPATDQQGMVFTIDHHHRRAVWANTQFDLKNGRFQYAYVIPHAMVTIITLRLTPASEKTRVSVIYERTSLAREADEHVRQLAEQDRSSGPHWEKSINDYLQKVGK